MKFLTLLLSLLFASNLYAEMQTSFCNAIDEKNMRFWNDKYAYTFNRANGAMMVYLGEEVVGVLECSFKK